MSVTTFDAASSSGSISCLFSVIGADRGDDVPGRTICRVTKYFFAVVHADQDVRLPRYFCVRSADALTVASDFLAIDCANAFAFCASRSATTMRSGLPTASIAMICASPTAAPAYAEHLSHLAREVLGRHCARRSGAQRRWGLNP